MHQPTTRADGVATPWSRHMATCGPLASSPHVPKPYDFFFLQIFLFWHNSLCSSCSYEQFSISLIWASFLTKFRGIAPWYVTPPIFQLVFPMVVYNSFILLLMMTRNMSMHVKFIWFKLVLMHGLVTRNLWGCLVKIIFSCVHSFWVVWQKQKKWRGSRTFFKKH